MGADLIVSICYAPECDEQTYSYSSEQIANALDQVKEKLAGLTDDRRNMIAEIAGIWEDDYGDDWKEAIEDRVMTAANDVLSGPRDVVLINVRGNWIFIGGGTSWGDSIEGCDNVSILSLVNPWGSS